MPHYNFLCQSCKRLFSRTLTLPEYEQVVIKCPFCGTDEVARGRWIEFPFRACREERLSTDSSLQRLTITLEASSL